MKHISYLNFQSSPSINQNNLISHKYSFDKFIMKAAKNHKKKNIHKKFSFEVHKNANFNR